MIIIIFNYFIKKISIFILNWSYLKVFNKTLKINNYLLKKLLLYFKILENKLIIKIQKLEILFLIFNFFYIINKLNKIKIQK